MILCPIALVTGCANCPAVRICPAKTLLGDYRPPQAPPPAGRKPLATPRKKSRA